MAANSVFNHFNSKIDAVAIVQSHEDKARQPRDGYKVNYFGVAISKSNIPIHIVDYVADLEASPLPANWHSDTAEFAAALRAVDCAEDTFTMIELGCNWGCWMNITGAAARRRGKKVKLIGVEGDEPYIENARRAMADNGFQPEDYDLVHGIAAARRGTAAFPVRDQSGDNWGLSPLFDADGPRLFSRQRRRFKAALASGKYAPLPMHALEDIIAPYERIDLLHIDIQGGEMDIVPSCIELLTRKVAYVFVGTHSREIEGVMFDTFLKAGWDLEIERPAVLTLAEKPEVYVDGAQGWRNPALIPA